MNDFMCDLSRTRCKDHQYGRLKKRLGQLPIPVHLDNGCFTWTWEAGHAAQDCDILLEVSGDHNHPISPDCKMPVAPRRYAAQMMEATNMGPMQAMVAGLADPSDVGHNKIDWEETSECMAQVAAVVLKMLSI